MRLSSLREEFPYPTTGSTGDGYGWAKRLGHGLVDTRPALVPMAALEDYIPPCRDYLSRNVTLRIRDQRAENSTGNSGDALYALWVSGPLVLTASSLVEKKAGGGRELSRRV